jgi:hypothetical protein
MGRSEQATDETAAQGEGGALMSSNDTLDALEKKVQQATEYVVLEQRELRAGNEAVIGWVEVGRASSTTRAGAVREVAGEREGVWRPVPARNWGGALKTRERIEKKIDVEEVEPF